MLKLINNMDFPHIFYLDKDHPDHIIFAGCFTVNDSSLIFIKKPGLPLLNNLLICMSKNLN
jgi:hypothetical protein